MLLFNYLQENIHFQVAAAKIVKKTYDVYKLHTFNDFFLRLFIINSSSII